MLEIIEWLERITNIFERITGLFKMVSEQTSKLTTIMSSPVLFFFTLGIITTIGYGLSNLGKTLCKILMIVFWSLFFLFLARELLQI
jgi:hypothetical protein